MDSKGISSAPPAYTDSVPPPSYPASAPYPAGPPMGAPMAPPYPAQPVQPAQPAQPPVVVQTVYVQPSQSFGAQPVQTTCPTCHQVVLTRVRYSPGALTWISCGGLFVFGCIFGCCLIPFCIDSLQDVDHNCPNCGAHLACFRRL